MWFNKIVLLVITIDPNLCSSVIIDLNKISDKNIIPKQNRIIKIKMLSKHYVANKVKNSNEVTVVVIAEVAAAMHKNAISTTEKLMLVVLSTIIQLMRILPMILFAVNKFLRWRNTRHRQPDLYNLRRHSNNNNNNNIIDCCYLHY